MNQGFASGDLSSKDPLVKSIPNHEWKRNPLDLKPLPMKYVDWLGTPAGEWVVAIGLVAITVSLFAFTVQDVLALLTGNLFSLRLYHLPICLAKTRACIIFYFDDITHPGKVCQDASATTQTGCSMPPVRFFWRSSCVPRSSIG